MPTFVLGFIAALTLSTSVASTRDVSIFAFIAILRKNTCVPATYNVLYLTYIHYMIQVETQVYTDHDDSTS